MDGTGEKGVAPRQHFAFHVTVKVVMEINKYIGICSYRTSISISQRGDENTNTPLNASVSTRRCLPCVRAIITLQHCTCFVRDDSA